MKVHGGFALLMLCMALEKPFATASTPSTKPNSGFNTFLEKARRRTFGLFSSIGATRELQTLDPATDYHYSQLGLDFDGSFQDDSLGNAVAISKDGQRVAISSSGESQARGVTRVYDWSTADEEWIQIGGIIRGQRSKYALGTSTALSDDGKRIALGSPGRQYYDGSMKVYELDATNNWVQLGGEITPVEKDGYAGISVDMNGDGTKVIFGAPRTNALKGRAKAYQLVNGQWEEYGQTIDSSTRAFFGGAVAMDGSGTRIVIGGRLGSFTLGLVEIYDYDDSSSTWILQKDIDGLAYYDRFGTAVDITEDGNRIIVGAFTSDGQEENRNNAGEVMVFEYDQASEDWVSLGQTILGGVQSDKLGESVAISGDGTHIVVASPENDDTVRNAGKVEVYKLQGDVWVQQGVDLYGECEQTFFGQGGNAVAVDGTGRHIVIGARNGNYYAGLARVFEALEGEGDDNTVNGCPTFSPTTPKPSPAPTKPPSPAPTTVPTAAPTPVPTVEPTPVPTAVPTRGPTATPTSAPTPVPTSVPTAAPTPVPTPVPTTEPTTAPTAGPTTAPTPVPTAEPTLDPTAAPTPVPTTAPTPVPTALPTPVPTVAPTPVPTPVPTPEPTPVPTNSPTPAPTAEPTLAPTPGPTVEPTSAPTPRPTEEEAQRPVSSAYSLILPSVTTFAAAMLSLFLMV